MAKHSLSWNKKHNSKKSGSGTVNPKLTISSDELVCIAPPPPPRVLELHG
jgi:hypothetical protein